MTREEEFRHAALESVTQYANYIDRSNSSKSKVMSMDDYLAALEGRNNAKATATKLAKKICDEFR